MTVTCLICGLLTYRVAQQVTPDLGTEEGPVLPTDDWVEKELCKSATGWIEVFQDTLVSGRFLPPLLHFGFERFLVSKGDALCSVVCYHRH